MIFKALSAAALLLPAILALPSQARAQQSHAQQTILPGYWESTSQVNLLGKGDPKTERRCITPEKVDEFMSGPSTGHYTCTYASSTVHGGVADFQGQCVDKHGAAFNVSLHGTYAPESFHMDGRMVLPNLAMFNGTATIDAHRISADCPAP